MEVPFGSGGMFRRVFAGVSVSGQRQTVAVAEGLDLGAYTEYFSQARVELTAGAPLHLEPWGYRVFVK